MIDGAVLGAFVPFVCPDCKCEISGPTVRGWKYPAMYHKGQKMGAQLVACSTCSDHAIARRKMAVIARLLDGANIPLRARSWSFDTAPSNIDRDVIDTCRQFVNRQGEEHGLYLYGDFGSGKTGLAIAIIKAAMQREEDAVFIRSLDLLDRLRQAIARGNDEGDQLLHLVKNVTWLALDDLATERPTDFVIEKLQSILETRRDLGLYTAITSNLHFRELESCWRPLDPDTRKSMPTGTRHAGRRVLERLAEYCQVIHVRGKNLRQGKTVESVRSLKEAQ